MTSKSIGICLKIDQVEYSQSSRQGNGGWTDIMERRKGQIRRFCAKQDDSRQITAVGNFWVADGIKVLYCSVEKAGCSTTKEVLKNVNHGSFPKRVHASEEFFNEKYKNYTKIMFVREPVERLVSAYRYITLTNISRFGGIVEDIKSEYRSNMSKALKVADVTFEEFIKYVVDDHRFKRHWHAYESLCQPCKIKFDFIGKYETLSDDLARVLMIFGNLTFDDAVKLVPHKNASPGKTSAELARDYMLDLSPSLREKLYTKFRNDYELFGYKFSW